MVSAEISRGNTSVELPLLAEGGTPLVARDIGKPNMNVYKNGVLDVRHSDQNSGLMTYTLLGRFHGSSAYSDAITLADLIKTNGNGTPLKVDIGLSEFDSNVMVAPAATQEEALQLNYPPGRRRTVEVDLGLTRISSTQGGSDQQANTPTDTGSGPITISKGSTNIEFVNDITVSRSLGRPQSEIKKTPSADFPKHFEKSKSAYDAFDLSFQFNSDTVTKINRLADMFSESLGRRPLTLDFNGLFGMGSFPVVPSGSGALRHVRESGKKETMLVPQVSLRRVLDVT